MPSFRRIKPEERELVLALVGNDSWRVKEEHIYRGTMPDPDTGIPRHFTMMADDGTVALFVDDSLPVLLHEYGHGTHALKYPESIDWPIWRAEAFAFMSDMRAMKRKGLLTPEQRKDFAWHLRGSRKHGNKDHIAGMKLAFRAVFSHTWPKNQEAHIVNAASPQS